MNIGGMLASQKAGNLQHAPPLPFPHEDHHDEHTGEGEANQHKGCHCDAIGRLQLVMVCGHLLTQIPEGREACTQNGIFYLR